LDLFWVECGQWSFPFLELDFEVFLEGPELLKWLDLDLKFFDDREFFFTQVKVLLLLYNIDHLETKPLQVIVHAVDLENEVFCLFQIVLISEAMHLLFLMFNFISEFRYLIFKFLLDLLPVFPDVIIVLFNDLSDIVNLSVCNFDCFEAVLSHLVLRVEAQHLEPLYQVSVGILKSLLLIVFDI